MNENSFNESHVKPFYDRVNFIFHALLAPPLLAFVWLYLEGDTGNSVALLSENIVGILAFLLPVFILMISGGAFYSFRKSLQTIEEQSHLISKLTAYKQAAIKMFLLLELALVLSVIGYYLTVATSFVAMFVIVLVFFSLVKPTPYRIANSLRLKGEEKDIVLNKRVED